MERNKREDDFFFITDNDILYWAGTNKNKLVVRKDATLAGFIIDPDALDEKRFYKRLPSDYLESRIKHKIYEPVDLTDIDEFEKVRLIIQLTGIKSRLYEIQHNLPRGSANSTFWTYTSKRYQRQ